MATQTSSTPAVTLTRVTLARIGYSNIYSLKEDASAFFYESGMMIDADGAYKAYHPDNKSGLDYLGNAGTPGNWWALVTDNGSPGGKPLIQADTDPAPGFYISTTTLEDAVKSTSDPRRYVDSSSISFIVLPGRFRFGAGLGDLCVVYNPDTQKLNGGIFGDVGPSDKIGEASIAMANALGVPSNPKNGGKVSNIGYIVFPHSSAGWPLNEANIQQAAMAQFNTWGGMDKFKVVFPELFE